MELKKKSSEKLQQCKLTHKSHETKHDTLATAARHEMTIVVGLYATLPACYDCNSQGHILTFH